MKKNSKFYQKKCKKNSNNLIKFLSKKNQKNIIKKIILKSKNKFKKNFIKNKFQISFKK